LLLTRSNRWPVDDTRARRAYPGTVHQGRSGSVGYSLRRPSSTVGAAPAAPEAI